MTKFNKGGLRRDSAAPESGRNSAMLRRCLGGVSIGAMSMAFASAAFAQAAAPAAGGAQTIQEVVVTGSRIARPNAVANSPIVTLGTQALMNQADLQIQNTLNKLPQFSPDQNLMGANAGDVQATPTHSLGISTASLRGLGPNRNLVLVDGQRYAPVNAMLVIDLSTIPTSMIDRVDAITGGASAVYGADAIGGVVNFIMKKNFQGLDVDGQYGINQRGDGRQYQASAVMGTNFADDKGNVTVALERFNSDASLQKNSPFIRKGWTDPTTTGTGFFPFGTAANPSPSAAGVAAVFGANSGIPTSSYFWVNNGQLFTGNQGFGGVAPIAGAAPAVNGASITNGRALVPGTQTIIPTLKYNQTVGYIQSPLSRWSMMANGHYDINEWVTANFMADFSQTETNTLLTAPASFITGWTVNIPRDAGHPVPGQLATLLDSRANPSAPWTLSWLPSINGPLPPRGSSETNTVFYIRAGLNGKFPAMGGLNDWNWNLTGSHSESQQYVVASGDYSLSRFQALITSPNYGANQTFQGNFFQPSGVPGQTSVGPNFNFGTGQGQKCTSGFYNALFNNAPLSKDCLDAMNAPLQSMNITKQDAVEYNMSGSLFKLPAGTVKANLGADYRRDSNIFNPDILQSNASFLDQVVGVYPESYLNVSQDVKEGYGELDIPILADLPFIKSLSFNPGLRYSSYNTSKGGYTYKLMGDMQVNDYVRLRGGYNVAIRAPNLGELFQGASEVFGAGSSYGDACSLLSTAPFGAGGAATTIQNTSAPVANKGGLSAAQNALAVCRALMNKAGGQAAITAFYGDPATAQPNPGPQAFAWNNQSGNPNLLPETAKTYTAGIQLRSPFQDARFNRMNLSVDYYKIHIDNAIEFATIDFTYQNCLNQPAATALDSLYCQAISRSPQSGASALSNTPEANLATIDTAGVDLQFDYSVQLSDLKKDLPGRFGLNIVSSFLINYDTISAPGFAAQKWYGTLGPTLAGTNPGAYAYKLNTSFTYSVGPAFINLNWRHLPQVNAATSVSPGNTTLPTKAYDVFDLNTNWSLPHRMQLRVGVQNLFDTQPPTTGATISTLVNGNPVTLPSSGQGTSNPAYYDELGRRFYVGLKARF
jgi:iron complex outermembrane receptor protein